MKIPFDIKFKPQIESGEYKVKTRHGKPVRIICWDKKTGGRDSIVALVTGESGVNEKTIHYDCNGRCISSGICECDKDLFIVTPEPELTSWQAFISGCLQKYGLLDCGAADRIAKECSAELLELARKELEPEVLERLEAAYKNQDEVVYENGKREGKAEALGTRATELTKNLAKSGLDKDSIPYHLIEFMCNLYTCQNWKEIEETAEAYVTRVKAAAMKDLPRWKKAVGYCFVGPSIMYDNLGFYKSSTTKPGCRYITYESLRILPSFNE